MPRIPGAKEATAKVGPAILDQVFGTALPAAALMAVEEVDLTVGFHDDVEGPAPDLFVLREAELLMGVMIQATQTKRCAYHGAEVLGQQHGTLH